MYWWFCLPCVQTILSIKQCHNASINQRVGTWFSITMKKGILQCLGFTSQDLCTAQQQLNVTDQFLKPLISERLHLDPVRPQSDSVKQASQQPSSYRAEESIPSQHDKPTEGASNFSSVSVSFMPLLKGSWFIFFLGLSLGLHSSRLKCCTWNTQSFGASGSIRSILGDTRRLIYPRGRGVAFHAFQDFQLLLRYTIKPYVFCHLIVFHFPLYRCGCG